MVAPDACLPIEPIYVSYDQAAMSGGLRTSCVFTLLRGGACRTIIRSFNHLSKQASRGGHGRRKNPRMDHRDTPRMTGATAMEHRTRGARNGLRSQGVALTRRQRLF
jgi:hypothetical protein